MAVSCFPPFGDSVQIGIVALAYPETLQAIATFIDGKFKKYCQTVKEDDESTTKLLDFDEVLDDNGDIDGIVKVYGPRNHKPPDLEKAAFHVVEAAETVLFLIWKWRNELRDMEEPITEELYTIRSRFGSMMIDRIFVKIIDDQTFDEVLYNIVMGEEMPYQYFNIRTIRQYINQRMRECSTSTRAFWDRNRDRREELMDLFGNVMIGEEFITEQEFGQVAVKSANKT